MSARSHSSCKSQELAELDALFGDETWPVWILRLFELNPLTGILDIYHRVFFPNHYSSRLVCLALRPSDRSSLSVIGWRHVFNRLESRVLKEM